MKFDTELEQKWASFFDELEIEYFYKEMAFVRKEFVIKPTFYLPNVYLRNDKGVFLMINEKPQTYDRPERFFQNLVEFVGEPKENLFAGIEQPKGTELSPFYDSPMGFWLCDNCDTAKIEFCEGNYNDCPRCMVENQTNVSQKIVDAIND